MTDKTMPERIGAYRYDKTLKHAGSTANGTWADARNHMYREGAWAHAEYIRADLAPAQESADEPLADGQYRWLKIYGSWFACYIASLTRGEGNFYFLIPGYDSGFPRGDKMVEEVGPAIQPPPADNAN